MAAMEMKALSIKQPWANRIIFKGKTIETRTWRTDYRGNLLIVSSRKPDIPRAGYALGWVNLVDCRKMTPMDERAAQCQYQPGLFAWVFDGKVWTLNPPYRMQGKQGLYDVTLPDSIEWVC